MTGKRSMKIVMTATLTLILILSAYLDMFAQDPDIEWRRDLYYGSQTEAWDFVETEDLGYLIAGAVGPPEITSHVLLIKTSLGGQVEWTVTVGGNSANAARAVRETPDGGFIVTGYTSSFGAGNKDVYLIRVDSQGDTLWTRTFGGEYDDVGRSVELTGNDGYIINGWTASYGAGGDDMYVIKADLDGELVWQRTFGTSSTERGWSVQPVPSGRFGLAGWTEYNPDEGILFVLVDRFGNEISQRTHSGIEARDIILVDNSEYENFIICGGSRPIANSEITLLRVTVIGIMMWQRNYADNAIGHCLDNTTDGGYIIGGYGVGYEGAAYIIKTRSDGHQQWMKTIAMPVGTKIRGIKQVYDGGYILVGYNASYSFIIKLSSEITDIEENSLELPSNIALGQNYPNPFNATTTIRYTLPEQSDVRIEIYNILGQKVVTLFDGVQEPGYHPLTWRADDFASGVYFATLEAANRSEKVKMVLLK